MLRENNTAFFKLKAVCKSNNIFNRFLLSKNKQPFLTDDAICYITKDSLWRKATKCAKFSLIIIFPKNISI